MSFIGCLEGHQRGMQAMGRQSGADARFEKRLRALGFAVVGLQNAHDRVKDEGVRLTDLRFKLDADNRTSVLVILKGEGGEGPLVGFTGGLDLETAVLSAWGKVKAKTVHWRIDRPWPAP